MNLSGLSQHCLILHRTTVPLPEGLLRNYCKYQKFVYSNSYISIWFRLIILRYWSPAASKATLLMAYLVMWILHFFKFFFEQTKLLFVFLSIFLLLRISKYHNPRRPCPFYLFESIVKQIFIAFNIDGLPIFFDSTIGNINTLLQLRVWHQTII
jgi:hypothetical protein